ncbi:MAG: agmatine deiminase family protein [Cyclobacteriaceae bacterium]|nr:agmatine deiminase family protein [Cyclobacteriaceae bacterium]
MKILIWSGRRVSVRNISLVVLFIFIIVFSCKERFSDGPFSPAAEFDEQESTMLCWNPKFRQIIIPLVTEISKDDHVTLFFNENYHNKKQIERFLLQQNAEMSNIDLHPFKLEKDNIWIRDYGPSFLENEQGQLAVVGFEYPHLEYFDYNNFSPQVSGKMKIPFFKSKLFSTGGGREINGKGTIILLEGYEEQINPKLSKAEIEAEYREKYNQTNFIWLKRGIPQDDFFGYGPITEDIYGYGVNWHIDEFCRFADAGTILLAEVDSSDMKRDKFYKIIHDRLEENFRILSQALDQNGNPFKIIRVPQAPVIYIRGQLKGTDILYTPVTSYLNFVLTNHSVVVPSYYKVGDPDFISEKDEEVRQVFQGVFKNRKIVSIDATDLNYKGGGLHCITIHKPKTKKRLPGTLIKRKQVG